MATLLIWHIWGNKSFPAGRANQPSLMLPGPLSFTQIFCVDHRWGYKPFGICVGSSNPFQWHGKILTDTPPHLSGTLGSLQEWQGFLRALFHTGTEEGLGLATPYHSFYSFIANSLSHSKILSGSGFHCQVNMFPPWGFILQVRWQNTWTTCTKHLFCEFSFLCIARAEEMSFPMLHGRKSLNLSSKYPCPLFIINPVYKSVEQSLHCGTTVLQSDSLVNT